MAALPTRTRIDLTRIAESRLKQARSFLVPALTSTMVAYSRTLEPQVGPVMKVMKELGKQVKYQKKVVMEKGASLFIPDDFQKTAGLRKREAKQFLSFFMNLKLFYNALEDVIHLVEADQTQPALDMMNRLNAQARRLYGELQEPYMQSVYLVWLKNVQEELGRVVTMLDQAWRLLRSAIKAA